MSRKKKNDVNPKKIAVISLIVAVVLLTIWLVVTIVDERREPVSELLELTEIKKEEGRVLLSYKAYEQFLEENDLEGKLKKSNFRTSNYILLVGNFSKDDKITDVSISSVTGVVIEMEENSVKDEKLAYLIPVPKSKAISGLDVTLDKE